MKILATGGSSLEKEKAFMKSLAMGSYCFEGRRLA